MKMLIVAATEFEIKGLVSEMVFVSAINNQVKSYIYKDLVVDVLITGIGMVAVTYHLTKAISKQYACIINAGICGVFDKSVSLGDIVNITTDSLSELGAEDDKDFLSFKDIGLKVEDKMINNSILKNEMINSLKKVNGITVNTIHGNEISIAKIIEKYNPYTESMEGAAFMFVCSNEKIPYVQIRSISNYVERRNKNNWKMDLAIENLNEKLIAILMSF